MNNFNSHPTVLKVKALNSLKTSEKENTVLDRDWIKQLILECGADDTGFVSIDSHDLDDQREDILKSFPRAKTVISIICKTNQFAIRSPMRSVSNNELHHVGKHVDEVCIDIAKKLNDNGIAAMNEPMAFPMEYTNNFPDDKSWIISHKKVAVAAGMGKMGIHRNVIHPKFGNFILLGSVVIENEVTGPKESYLDYNPCLECKLCIAACPVGAISPQGYFNFSACVTHNYREFMGGFVDWVKAVTESDSMSSYQDKFSDTETVSLWQSLTYGANYKAAYCIAVCPAGEDIISPFLENRKGFISEVVRPLQEKKESIYVIKGSDASDYVKKKFPHKSLKYVGNSLNPKTIEGFLFGTTLAFQPMQSKGLEAIYHFSFTGKETIDATLIIKDQKLTVEKGLVGIPNLKITADSQSWINFLGKRLNLFVA
ncbi:4Fe-4S ferredoxin, partial [bacterium]